MTPMIAAGIFAHKQIRLFFDEKLNVATEKAVEDILAVMNLHESEARFCANRARSISKLNAVECLVWVGNNRENSLENLRKLRRVYEDLQAA